MRTGKTLKKPHLSGCAAEKQIPSVISNRSYPAFSSRPTQRRLLGMHWLGIITICVVLSAAWNVRAQSTGVAKNRPDEARAAYSPEKAIDFIERSVSSWQDRRRCVTCHTNGLHLVAGAQTTPNSKILISSQEFTRDYLTSYITGTAKPHGQRGAIEGIVAGASFLAISEMTTDKKLHARTISALDYIWSKQDPSGAWEDWLKCHWGPYEVDDHFGVTLATIALAMAPTDYRSKPNAKEAEKKLHQYLKTNAPTAPHQQAMMLWAARHVPELATAEQKQKWIESLRKLQQEDGGWVLAQLGDAQWLREDRKPHHQISDGYATAIVDRVAPETAARRWGLGLGSARRCAVAA